MLLLDSYNRENLRQIALPGHAVSTLFWALPIGKWSERQLNDWLDLFTTGKGSSQQLGLLLLRDGRNRSDTTILDTSNLETGLADMGGGNLLDLIPEAKFHGHHRPNSNIDEKSILIFSGAYPQPGWGVLITVMRRIERSFQFEELIEQVIQKSCPADKVATILSAARAYHERDSARTGHPREPLLPPELTEMRKALDCILEVFSALDTGRAPDLRAATTKAERAIQRSLDAEFHAPDGFWPDLSGRIRLIRDFTTALRDNENGIATIVREYDLKQDNEKDSFLAQLHPREGSLLRKLRFLRKTWAELQIHEITAFLATTYRENLRGLVETALAPGRSELERRLAELSVKTETEMQRYRGNLNAWEERQRNAEASYRAVLPDASRAQWDMGPAFLMALEAECASQGIPARSVPWDPARMIGWKLHVSNPGIHPQDLLLAANTVLGKDTSQPGATLPEGEFSGSLFADYAYFVSISAQRMSPWNATKRLFTELLSPGQFRILIGDADGQIQLTTSTKDQLAEQLLHRWGWHDRHSDIPRPLVGCTQRNACGKTTLGKPLNETRISLEGFLKDLTRITLATLGWKDADMEEQISIHCPAYRKSTIGPWKAEMEKLTSGGALMLLKDLLPLGFPEQIDKSKSLALCADCSKLLKSLNSGSHDPPPPPPTPEELSRYAEAIESIVAKVREVVGEMPWHLSPAQTFGSEPLIVTGHAWSHSHVEERMIRVMLWAGDQSSKDMLVWNKALTNPVMTDAVLL